MLKRSSVLIDCLRAVSIYAVLLYHYVKWPYGIYGVMLFFIISGYCIMLSADSSAGSWAFYAKRISRLMPALVLCGAVSVLVKQTADFFPERAVSWGDFGAALLALPTANILAFDFAWPDGAYWSLAIEFQFYLLVSLLIFVCKRKNLASSIAGCSVILNLAAICYGFSWPIISYLPYFLAGIGLKTIFHDDKRGPGIAIVAIAIIQAGLQYMSGISDASMPSSPGSVAAFLVCISLFVGAMRFEKGINHSAPRSSRLLSVLAAAGLVSYPCYLLHQDVGLWITEWLDQSIQLENHSIANGAFRVLVLPAFMFAAATFVYVAIERPLGKRLSVALTAIPESISRIALRALRIGAPPSRVEIRLICISVVVLMSAILFFGVRLLERRNAEQVIATIRSVIAAPLPIQSATPWGMLQVATSPGGKVIDVHDVPSASCAHILVEASHISGVQRVAASIQAADEVAAPIRWLDAERACLGFKRRLVRVFSVVAN